MSQCLQIFHLRAPFAMTKPQEQLLRLPVDVVAGERAFFHMLHRLEDRAVEARYDLETKHLEERERAALQKEAKVLEGMLLLPDLQSYLRHHIFAADS